MSRQYVPLIERLAACTASGALRRDLLGQIGHSRVELPGGIDRIDQADAQRLVGVDAAGRVDQLLGQADPDRARQPLGAAHVGHDAEPDLGDGEDRALGGEADVAAERQLEAAADADALERGDDRHAAGLEPAEALLQMREMPADGGERRAGEPSSPSAESVEPALTSSPAQKAPPAPVRTATRASGARSMAAAASPMASHISTSSAFSRSGLLSVMVATGALISSWTLSVMAVALAVERADHRGSRGSFWFGR